MLDYKKFVASKRAAFAGVGIQIEISAVHPLLMPFQRDIVRWACAKGRCAVFADTGLGKTYIQLEWARLMGKNTLIIAPLTVARQTVRMAKDIDLDVRYVRSQAQVTPDHSLWITNYEMRINPRPALKGTETSSRACHQSAHRSAMSLAR